MALWIGAGQSAISNHAAIPEASTAAPQRIEMITGHERRRRYTDEDRARLVAKASEPGQSVSTLARRQDIERDENPLGRPRRICSVPGTLWNVGLSTQRRLKP